MRFLTLRETAEKVGYHRVHVMRLAKAGKFPKPIKMNNFAIRFVDKEVENFMNERISERDAGDG